LPDHHGHHNLPEGDHPHPHPHPHGHVHDPVAEARGATWLGIAGNVILAAAKVAGGLVSGSAALVADGVHSGSDVASSVFILIGLRVSERGPDEKHPYGHGKAETIAAASVAGLLALLGAGIIWRAAAGMLGDAGHGGTIAPLAIYIEIAAILVKEALFQYKIRLGRRLGSMGLVADAWHHRSDVYSSLAALAGVLGAVAGGPEWHFLDGVASIFVSFFIMRSGYQIFRESSSLLMDEVVKGETVRELREKIHTVEGVLGVEKLIVRRSGMDLLVDVHVELPPDMTVADAHRISQHVKEYLTGLEEPRITSVLVHIEPFCGGDHTSEEMGDLE